MKLSIKIIILLMPALFLAGCNSLADLAEGILYANEQVNKKYPVRETPPEGYTEQSFTFNGEDGSPVDVRAWVYRQANPTATTVVLCHGNGENLETLYISNMLTVVASLGVNIVAVDYPSYGRSTGIRNEYNFVTGVVKATEWAHKNLPRGKLIMWGRSMGASVALLAAVKTQSRLNGLILTSPWTSFYELALDRTGLAKQIPKEWLAKHGYDSAKNAPAIKIPVLIHHGVKDKVVPIKFGRKLATKFPASTPLMMKEFADKEHNDIFQEKQIWQDIYDFVR
jgi:uncharacterized protein